MAKKKTDAEVTKSLVSDKPDVQRPRLRKLSVRNFRCIGPKPVEIELDDIVVLVGPNNVGKSSILRAYQVAMSQGSKGADLTLDDFPNAQIDPKNLPEVELETVIYDATAPGERWVAKDGQTGDLVVRERWVWADEGAPTRAGFDVAKGEWDEQVPWGAPHVANAYRPVPHRVEAFASPEKLAEEVAELLTEVLKERIKALQGAQAGEQNQYMKLLDGIREIQKTIVAEATPEIARIEKSLTGIVKEVFPDHIVKFDARPEQDVEECLDLFQTSVLRMGPEKGHYSTVDKQGSGARRTLLWAALRILSEEQDTKKVRDPLKRPHLLLMDEPELCLHPDAIREACRVLYDLPKSGNWQVVVTTHSPAFIDLSRDNTSIVRVSREPDGSIFGTTIFRPKKANLGEDDKERLKILNACDPYVAEFFFGGRTILVEGDTEYTAFKYVQAVFPGMFKNLHVVRARGKATIVTLCKILNQFGADYAVLHDSDRQAVTTRKTKKIIVNPAWTVNSRILDETKNAPKSAAVRLVASVPNFEEAFLGEEAEDEKPYSALLKMKSDGQTVGTIKALLSALADHSKGLPANAVQWDTLANLQKSLKD